MAVCILSYELFYNPIDTSMSQRNRRAFASQSIIGDDNYIRNSRERERELIAFYCALRKSNKCTFTVLAN
jgi:hypothetical protein